MSEEIEVAPPAEQPGEFVVRMGDEVLPPLRGRGRPRTIQTPEPSLHDKMRKYVASQGIELSDEQFETVWKKYCELRKFVGPEQLSGYWLWSCPGCRNSDGQRYIANGKHSPQCDGVDIELVILWPANVAKAVALQKNVTVPFLKE